jgi:nitroreductase
MSASTLRYQAASPHPDPRPIAFNTVADLIESRRNVSPRRLVAPGPTAEQLWALLDLAGAAPDHGQLAPWRFILVPSEQRHRLADAFALALIDRDAAATPEQIKTDGKKAYRAPVLVIAIALLGPRDPDIPALERMVSMGAGIKNVLLGAWAMGFDADLTSGKAMTSKRLRVLCALTEGEMPVCCINLGTALAPKPTPREGARAALTMSVMCASRLPR